MKNEEKLKNWGVWEKVRYYYLRFGVDEHSRALYGVATVCVIPVETAAGVIFVRGVAFCVPRDQFSRKAGRPIALGRAVKAIETETCGDIIPIGSPAGVLKYEQGWSHFSVYNIKLTKYEERLFLRGSKMSWSKFRQDWERYIQMLRQNGFIPKPKPGPGFVNPEKNWR